MRDDVDDYRISWRLDGEPCEVYLFRRWGTYQHPVLPLDPLSHAEALTSPALCRAYVRDAGGEPRMVRFSSHGADTRTIRLAVAVPPGPYALAVAADGSEGPGAPLTSTEAAMADRLLLVNEPGDVAIVRALTWSYTFDYEYGPDGALRATTVTNRDGRRVFPA